MLVKRKLVGLDSINLSECSTFDSNILGGIVSQQVTLHGVPPASNMHLHVDRGREAQAYRHKIVMVANPEW